MLCATVFNDPHSEGSRTPSSEELSRSQLVDCMLCRYSEKCGHNSTSEEGTARAAAEFVWTVSYNYMKLFNQWSEIGLFRECESLQQSCHGVTQGF